MRVLGEGRPIFAGGDDDRIGRGPWARWLATSVVRDEGSPRAERGRILARSGHVHTVVVDVGAITALVIGSGGAEYRVSLGADPIPPRVWSAVVGSPRGRELFQAAAEGREQSLQLEHVMTVDWEEPLRSSLARGADIVHVPRRRLRGPLQARVRARLRRRCGGRRRSRDPARVAGVRPGRCGGGSGPGRRDSALPEIPGSPVRCPCSGHRGRCPSAPSSSGSATAASSSTGSTFERRSSPRTPRSPARSRLQTSRRCRQRGRGASRAPPARSATRTRASRRSARTNSRRSRCSSCCRCPVARTRSQARSRARRDRDGHRARHPAPPRSRGR